MKYPTHRYRFASGIAHIVFILVAIAAIIFVLSATGVLKFKGKFEINKNQKTSSLQNTNSQETTPAKEEPKQPTPSPKSLALTKTYTNSQLKFELKHPESWTEQEVKTGVNIYAPVIGDNSAAKSDAAAIVSTSPLGTLKGLQLSSIADVMKNQMGSFLPGATVVKTTAANINGREAYVFDLDYYNNGQNYPSKFYLQISNENLYGLITSVSESKKGNYEETLKAVVDTFKIL